MPRRADNDDSGETRFRRRGDRIRPSGADRSDGLDGKKFGHRRERIRDQIDKPQLRDFY